jgi:hypothetical protein
VQPGSRRKPTAPRTAGHLVGSQLTAPFTNRRPRRPSSWWPASLLLRVDGYLEQQRRPCDCLGDNAEAWFAQTRRPSSFRTGTLAGRELASCACRIAPGREVSAGNPRWSPCDESSSAPRPHLRSHHRAAARKRTARGARWRPRRRGSYREGDYFGRAVNLAARLLGLALACQDVRLRRRRARDRGPLRRGSRGGQDIRGFGAPVSVHRLRPGSYA